LKPENLDPAHLNTSPAALTNSENTLDLIKEGYTHDLDLQTLWDALTRHDRIRPIAKKWDISDAKCTIDAADPLLFRSNLVVPTSDPPRTQQIE
jgi:hypothetical protein